MFSIIKRELITLARDKADIFFIVLFPSMLVFLLGNLLQHMDTSDAAIPPIEMAYTVETTDPFGLAATDAFMQALGGQAQLSVSKAGSAEAAKKQVDSGALSAAVRFTQPFGIEIYEGHDSLQNRVIDSVFKGFSHRTASLAVLARHAPEKLESAANAEAEGLVQQKEFGYSRTMLDYYAVVMTVMILFMGGAIGGASVLYWSRKDGTLRRMMASPKNRASLYVQSVLGSALPQNIIQVGCIMLSSTLLFGARYASTWQDNLLLVATMLLAGVSLNALFMLLSIFIKVTPTLVFMPVLWVLMFLSGTFSKEIYIEGFTNRSPIWLVQNAAFDLTVFGRGEKCLQVMLVSAAVLAVSTCAGALLFRRKGLVTE